jgi:hypothetical protein
MPYPSNSTQDYPSVVLKQDGSPITVWQDDCWDRDPAYYPDTTSILVDISGIYGIVFVASDTWTMQYMPVAAPDNNSGVIVAWIDERNGYPSRDIYAQRISGSDGSRLWSSSDVAVCTAPGEQVLHSMIPDGSGGAIIAWYDDRDGGNRDIYAQRLDSLGAALWTPEGVCVCGDPSQQSGLQMTSDGSGGAIFTWYDNRNGTSDIFAQRIDAAGGVDWQTDGVAVCSSSSYESDPVIAGDGEGGACIAWNDQRNGLMDVYAQRLDSNGANIWTADGIAVTSDGDDQNMPQILRSGSGHYFISWNDHRTGGKDLRLQKLDQDGTALWAQDGVIVCSAGYFFGDRLVTDGSGGAIAAWHTDRNGNYDIYAARVFPDGSLGWEPSLDAAEDLPGDEGGWVRLSVTAPSHDNAGVDYYQVIGYNIWRRVDSASAAVSSAEDYAPSAKDPGSCVMKSVLAADAEGNIYTPPPGRLFPGASDPGEILRAPAAIDYDFPPGDWESIGYTAARQQPSYLFAVPTRSDSTSSGIPWEHYVVTIHTTDPAYYFIVGPDSAYSVDDLAPAQPVGLAGHAMEGPPGIELTWEPNEETDISHYSVWRGSSESFIPAGSNHLGDTSSPSFTDEYNGWYESWYKISAVDRHGNMSAPAVIGPDGMVTGDDPMPLPEATFLAQNFPNPFNPITNIAFAIKESGHVSLRIYDAAGRSVATLVDESRPAGSYSTEWNGCGADGSSVASGIYFYRLRTEGFTETRKMVLIR